MKVNRKKKFLLHKSNPLIILKVMLTSPRSWAALVISGKNLDIDEISEILKNEPDYFHSSLKDPKTKEAIPAIWQLNSKLPDDQILESHLWEILKKIASSRDELRKIAKRHTVTFYCSIEKTDMNTKGFKLSPRIMTLLGSLGVSMEVNLWQEDNSNKISIL